LDQFTAFEAPEAGEANAPTTAINALASAGSSEVDISPSPGSNEHPSALSSPGPDGSKKSTSQSLSSARSL
jgi:hypothetical protein